MQSTKNYGKFNFLTYNRDIDESHVKRLIKDLEEGNLTKYQPILIDKEWNVIDGQHRILAAKKLAIDVFYEIVPDHLVEKVLISLNRHKKNWILVDFFKYYLNKGYPEYEKLDSFMKEYNLTFKEVTFFVPGLFSNSHGNKDHFRSGNFKFKVTDIDRNILSNLVDILYELSRLTGIRLERLKAQKLTIPLSKVLSHPNYHQDILLKNIKSLSMRFSLKSTTQENLKMMIEFYNFKNRVHKIPLEDLISEKEGQGDE